MQIEKLTPGMVVFDVGRAKMGNTSRSTVAVWPVQIIAVDLGKRTVQASWNNNPPRTFLEKAWKKWRKERPLLVALPFGGYRLATREEIAEAKEKD